MVDEVGGVGGSYPLCALVDKYTEAIINHNKLNTNTKIYQFCAKFYLNLKKSKIYQCSVVCSASNMMELTF